MPTIRPHTKVIANESGSVAMRSRWWSADMTAIMSADHHLDLIATLPLSFAITFVCGLIVGIPALRLSGVYLALVTFALAVSVPQFPLKFSKFTGGSNGIRTVTSPGNTWLYWVTWACA